MCAAHICCVQLQKEITMFELDENQILTVSGAEEGSSGGGGGSSEENGRPRPPVSSEEDRWRSSYSSNGYS